LATDIYGIANGIKNADGILLGGSHMVNVQKNLSPDLVEIIVLVCGRAGQIWGQVCGYTAVLD
jgi:hypothetical protein